MSRVTQDKKIAYLAANLHYYLSQINNTEIPCECSKPEVYGTYPLSQQLKDTNLPAIQVVNLIINELAGLTTNVETKSKNLWWDVKDFMNLENPTIKSIFKAMIDSIIANKYLDHLMFAVLQNTTSFLIAGNLNDIPKCLDFVKAKFGLLPKRTEYISWNYDGTIKLCHEKPTRIEYVQDRITSFFDPIQIANAANVMCAGPEVEGGFPSTEDALGFVRDAQDCGILTRINQFVPTSDISIHNVACRIEWNLAPFEFNAARIQWLKKFQELLKQHHWKSSTEETNTGTHIHIDRRILNTQQWIKLCDVFKQIPDDAKKNFFGRGSSHYCKWYENWYKIDTDFVYSGQDENGEEIYKRTEHLSGTDKMCLFNFMHKATVECRGFNSKVDLVKAHLGLNFVIVSVKANKDIDWIVNNFVKFYGKEN